MRSIPRTRTPSFGTWGSSSAPRRSLPDNAAIRASERQSSRCSPNLWGQLANNDVNRSHSRAKNPLGASAGRADGRSGDDEVVERAAVVAAAEPDAPVRRRRVGHRRDLLPRPEHPQRGTPALDPHRVHGAGDDRRVMSASSVRTPPATRKIPLVFGSLLSLKLTNQ